MDKKETIIISPEAEKHHQPKINKSLISVLILGKSTKDRREHLKYGIRIHLEWEHNDKMTLFQIVLYIRVLLLSICWETVDGAYFPNFGFVGCYWYDGHMKEFSYFTPTEVNVSTTKKSEIILCFKECLNNHTNYAGLKPKDRSIAGLNDIDYYQCLCGDDYNQTFAVDEAMCTYNNYKLMKIYNTDYDIKPLLSVPGNQSNLFEIWNATEKYKAMFVNDIMRNPAIDWWNDKLLYHTPEYVKVSAIDKHGRELWANEFFTNESSADLNKWLTTPNALNRKISTSTNISVNREQIVIKSREQQNKYFFLHGPINKDGLRVTVVSRDGTSQSNQNYGMNKLQKIKQSDFKIGEQYICGMEVLEIYNITTPSSQNEPIPQKQMISSTFFLDSCILASALDLNHNKTSVSVHVNMNWQDCTCYGHRPCECELLLRRINSSQLNISSPKCIAEMKVHNKYDLTINAERIIADLYGAYILNHTLPSGIKKTDEDVFIYTLEDDALLLADKVVILGYYHKEEPKVSKWEFLNNFSFTEIQNIMRPVLQKVQSQGSVPVRNLSSSVRKKESATDMRMSSQGIGILGGCLLGLVFLIIFVSDLVIIKVQLTALFKNLSRLCKTNNPRRISDFGEK